MDSRSQDQRTQGKEHTFNYSYPPLNDRSPSERGRVLEESLDFADSRVLNSVCACVTSDPSEFVRWRAVESLAHREQPQILSALVSAVRTDISSDVRQSAIDALATTQSGANLLGEFLFSLRDSEAVAAAKGMAKQIIKDETVDTLVARMQWKPAVGPLDIGATFLQQNTLWENTPRMRLIKETIRKVASPWKKEKYKDILGS